MGIGLGWYRRHLWETITYWLPSTTDVWGDNTAYTSAASLKGRWEDRHEEFIDFRGEVAYSNAIVYLNSAVALGGYLYKGTSSASDPKTVADAFPIRRLDRLGGYRESDGYIYIAYL